LNQEIDGGLGVGAGFGPRFVVGVVGGVLAAQEEEIAVGERAGAEAVGDGNIAREEADGFFGQHDVEEGKQKRQREGGSGGAGASAEAGASRRAAGV
jgi:hypothetical protein